MIDKGRLLNQGGHAVDGATVIVLPVLLNAAVGTTLTPLTRTTTDANGNFVLRLPATDDSQLSSARSKGFLNLHVIASYPGGQASWFVPVPGSRKTVGTSQLKLHNAPTVTADAKAATTVSPDAGTCVTSSTGSVPNVSINMGYKSSLDSSLAYADYQYTTNAALLPYPWVT
jgi:hypothetical protein